MLNLDPRTSGVIVGMIVGPLILMIAWLTVGMVKWGFSSWWFTIRLHWAGPEPVFSFTLYERRPE